MFEVSVQQTFAAAHNLRGYNGKCERLHGHNYRVEASVEGEQLNEIGLLYDFVEIRKAMKTVIDKVDHFYLNETPPFDAINPSAENIAKYFYEEMKALGVPVRAVRVWETDTAVATYRPK